MAGFVYKWVNNLDKKWYIGSHKGTTDDGYIGCGHTFSKKGSVNFAKNDTYFTRALKKHGIENFTRHILHENEDFRLVEELALQSHDAANNSMSYNMKNTSIGGWDHCRGLGFKFGKGNTYSVGNTNTKGMPSPKRKPITLFNKPYPSIEHAAKDLNVNYSNLRRWVRNGTVEKFIKI